MGRFQDTLFNSGWPEHVIPLTTLQPPPYLLMPCCLKCGVLENAGVFLPICVHRGGSNPPGCEWCRSHTILCSESWPSLWHWTLPKSVEGEPDFYLFWDDLLFSTWMSRGSLPYHWGSAIDQDVSPLERGMYFDFLNWQFQPSIQEVPWNGCALLLQSPPQSTSKVRGGGYAFCGKCYVLWRTQAASLPLPHSSGNFSQPGGLTWGLLEMGMRGGKDRWREELVHRLPHLPGHLVALISLEDLSGYNIRL